jgi:hypothetical protein
MMAGSSIPAAVISCAIPTRGEWPEIALEREQHGSYATQEKRTPRKARGEAEAIRSLY